MENKNAKKRRLLLLIAADVAGVLALLGVFVAVTILLFCHPAGAETSPRLSLKQVEARRAISNACNDGAPFTYSACMTRALQGQRLGLYVLAAPVPFLLEEKN